MRTTLPSSCAARNRRLRRPSEPNRRSRRGEETVPAWIDVALPNHMRVRSRDDLAEMFIRRMGAIHKRARNEMERIQSRQRAQLENLVTLLDGLVDIVADGQDDARW